MSHQIFYEIIKIQKYNSVDIFQKYHTISDTKMMERIYNANLLEAKFIHSQQTIIS